jgi:hypothetical protein|tara:strand:+ start:543 stop:860 length:318 start_codon:yes stop_codon:yes gene_type:complete
MALISYSINSIVCNGSTTVVAMTYHTGAISEANELTGTNGEIVDGLYVGNAIAVTRYRRTETVGTETITKSGTHSHDEMLEDLNTALATKASALGHTPIDEQTNE